MDIIFSVQVGLSVEPNEEDKRVPVIVWSVCAYTIESGGKLVTEAKVFGI